MSISDRLADAIGRFLSEPAQHGWVIVDFDGWADVIRRVWWFPTEEDARSWLDSHPCDGLAGGLYELFEPGDEA